VTPAGVDRQTAEERREQILAAALEVFAMRGHEGASTEEIARRVGISQPYLFRLFRTKRELYLATIDRCFAGTREMFTGASAGLTGHEALEAIGQAYMAQIQTDPHYLRAQLQAYAACHDDEIRLAVRSGFGSLVALIERISGLGTEEVSRFFAEGMLLNVMAAMHLLGGEDTPAWALRLAEGCIRGRL
jgi:AcrR family transcriptional regulator